MTDVKIRRLQPDEVSVLLAASGVFDEQVTEEWARRFLSSPGHHALLAFRGDEPVGFVTGVETTHPDKGTEMLLYELGVDEAHRGAGIGRALVTGLGDLARECGCYGMWVGTEPDNVAALATYRSAGADQPEPFVTLSWRFEA